MNTGRVMAILIKEAQDIRSNMNILLLYFVTIALTFIYSNLIPDMPAGFALGFGLLFLATMVGMYVPAMTIAEEKEKRTLEVLMLSPATPLEVFAGKGLLTFISILITMILLLVLSGNGTTHLAIIISGLAITSAVCIFVGMLVGLLAQNQMATGVIGTPIIMVFMLVPLLAQMGEEHIVRVAHLLPTYYFFEMLRMALDEGKGLGEMISHLGILSLFTVVTLGLLVFVYRKKGIEQNA